MWCRGLGQGVWPRGRSLPGRAHIARAAPLAAAAATAAAAAAAAAATAAAGHLIGRGRLTPVHCDQRVRRAQRRALLDVDGRAVREARAAHADERLGLGPQVRAARPAAAQPDRRGVSTQ